MNLVSVRRLSHLRKDLRARLRWSPRPERSDALGDLTVLLSMPRWTAHHSTDRNYIYDSFVSLSQRFGLSFVSPDSLHYVAAWCGEYLMQRALETAGAQADSSLFTPALAPDPCADAVFSYGKYPRLLRDKPVLWEHTFAPQLGVDEQEWRRHWRRTAVLAAAAATQVVTATELSAQWFADMFPEHAAKVHVIPYYLHETRAIDPARLRAKAEHAGPVRLLFVGKQGRRKGLDTLVRAWELLSTSDRARVSVRVISAMLDGPVELPPTWEHSHHVPDVVTAMEDAHVLVFPTKVEAFGLVLVEALAAGCIALTTSAPIQQSIVGSDAGVFIDPRDASALASAIASLASDPERLRAGMTAARERFLARYDPEVVGQQYADLMYRVAGRAAPAPKRAAQPAE